MIRNRFTIRRVARVVIAAGVLSSQIAYAQVTLNFVNADIDQVAKAIGAATDKTIIVDPRVKGQLNLVSEQPVPEEQALKTLQSALRMQGFSLVQDHGVLKVVPEAEARLQGVPTYIGNTPVARGDQVVTQVFRLRNESANNLFPVLRPLISPNNAIAAYPSNNTLVVTDYADNVRRIASIIAGIDTSAGQQVAIVPLHNANAPDAAAQLSKLLDPGSVGITDATLRVTVTSDPRTNSLLLRASSPDRMAAAKRLIAQIDQPTHEPGNMHVVPLRNADATQLAKTLRGMLGKGNDGGAENTSGAGGSGNGNDTSAGGGLPPLPSGMGSGSGSMSSLASNPLSGGRSSDRNGSGELPGGSNGNGNGGANDDSNAGGGMIQADPPTNSLIITASDPVYRNLRNVIDQLDVRRAQIYIESLIVETGQTTAASLGIQWQGLLFSNSGNNGIYAGTNYTGGGGNGSGVGNIVNLTGAGYALGANNFGLSTTAATTLLNNGINIGLLHKFGKFFGLGGLLNALSYVTDTNVLSTPNLVTLDNQDARIMVGQNVPIVTGSYASTGTGSTVTPFNTFDRQDVGITLHVRPQINADGTIKLSLYQEDSSVVGGTSKNQGGVTINKRSIQSTVLADDGEIIVLGGLIGDNYASSNNKVPWLGDLPVIGALFRSENKNRLKTNLMIFLRPVILRDQHSSSEISLNRYDYIRAQNGNYTSDNWMIQDHDVPAVPPPPPGPSQGVPAVQAPFDLNNMTRRSGSVRPDQASPLAPRAAPETAPQPVPGMRSNQP